MVTATLPALTDDTEVPGDERSPRAKHNTQLSRQSVAFSVESELTITPERYTRTLSNEHIPTAASAAAAADSDARAAPSKASALAGFVGLATGCGALVALVGFLPLPTRFGAIDGVTQGQAVSYSFYVVGVVSLLVAIFVFFGLRNLRGEEGKGWGVLLGLENKHGDGVGAYSEERTAKEVSQSLRAMRYDSCLTIFY